jgi:hypothetical protein
MGYHVIVREWKSHKNIWAQASPLNMFVGHNRQQKIKFQEKFKEAQEVAKINYSGTSQLKYKLKVEAFFTLL